MFNPDLSIYLLTKKIDLKIIGKRYTIPLMTSPDDYNLVEFQGINIDRNRRAELIGWLRSLENSELQAVLGNKSPAVISPASSDASFRRYFRITRADSPAAHKNSDTKPTPSWIIMDAPVALESTKPFIKVGQTLCDAGVNCPKIFGWEPSLGFILLEDFGSQTYLGFRQSNASTNQTTRLYQEAIDTLIQMQTAADTAHLPGYGVELLNAEMELFRHWLVLRHLARSWSRHDEKNWNQTKDLLRDDALSQEQVFVHRDYHSRNLMVLDTQPDLHETSMINPGVLDFQDAVKGPIFYDLVSLLKDCYATFSVDLFEQLLAYYFEQIEKTSLRTRDDQRQRQMFHTMGVQRHLKAAGIFARLWHRDGKSRYLKDIPRTLNYIVEAAQRDARYEWLADTIQQRVLPSLRMTNSSCEQ